MEGDSQEVGKMFYSITDDFKKALGKNLLSAVEYGTEGEPHNLLLVVEELDFDTLEKMKPLVIKCKKETKRVPLLFTEEELKDGLDVFPLEFLDIKYPHELLLGTDIIGGMEPDKKNVRRQLEFELRSKLIHLRENYMWIRKPKQLRALLQSAIPSLMPLFYGLLFLKNVKPPTKLEPLFKLVSKNYKVKLDVLRKVRALEEKRASEEELKKYTKDLITFLTKLGETVDEMKV